MSVTAELLARFDRGDVGPRVQYPSDEVAVVIFDRPECRNAINPAVMERFRAQLEQLADDSRVRVVIVTGANGAFNAGADLTILEQTAELTMTQAELLLVRLMEVAALLWALPQPTIAAVHGAAVGAGMALALACDIRVASPDAVLFPSFIRIGLLPDCGMSWLLPRLIGEGRALEMLLDGRPVAADRCEALGLFTQVCPDPFTAALELAATIPRRPAGAVRETKALLRKVAGATLNEAIHHEALAQAKAMHHQEFAQTIGPWRTTRQPD